jgi:menaquinone-specific isochorismate synthase
MTQPLHHTAAESGTATLASALGTLRLMVDEAMRATEPESCGREPVLRSFSLAIEPTDALAWLSRQQLFPRLYWMNREKSEWCAGIGAADRIELTGSGPNERSFLMLENEMQGKPAEARYFGGFCFNNRHPQNALWEGFSPILLILPLVAVEGSGSETRLTCSLLLHPGDDRDAAYRKLLGALESVDVSRFQPEDELPGIIDISYSPDRPQWIENCRKALKGFEKGEMEKVILARQTELGFTARVPALRFLMNYPYPESSTYRFYFEPTEGHAFFSFTPERLYRRDGERLLTEALAGTVTKEAIKADDNTASELLLNSEKDIREHRFVRDTIKQELEPVCSRIDMEEGVQVLHLSHLAHLYTTCRATLKPEFSNDSTVLAQLHPTPAVGGVPREESMRLISLIEPFCRGWYAAPVGWLSRGSAEFAVGIRSALVSDSRMYIYSGAGLVRGSDPEAEWEEVDQKIGEILSITKQSI